MISLYILTNYKGFFGSKQKTTPKYSGFDKQTFSIYFKELGFDVIYKDFDEVDLRNESYANKYILYTSSEDPGYFYKDYIEDIVYALSLQGAIVIPSFALLRANNNKVFMELLRDTIPDESFKNIQSYHFGTVEGLNKKTSLLSNPMVIKTARGAMSQGVALSKNFIDLVKKTKKLSRTRFWFSELWDFKNTFKYKGFVPESKYRGKFVVQNFIPNLDSDWKILIYNTKYYILRRGIKKGDFRASGSGILKFTEDIPSGILDFASKIFSALDVPNLSIDVAFDGTHYYLIEFQALYYGSYTLESSPFHFLLKDGNFQIVKEPSTLEKVFAESVASYILKKQ